MKKTFSPLTNGNAMQIANVLGVDVALAAERDVISLILDLCERRRKATITYANPYCLLTAQKDNEYREALDGCACIYPDGIGVVWAIRFLTGKTVPRVTASDFLPDFCRSAANRDIRIFFLGGHPGVPEQLIGKLRAQIGDFPVVGARHGFFVEEEQSELIDEINRSGANCVILGMGVPRQEKWAAKYRTVLDAPVLWSVGGAFDFYSERRKRAPDWMIRCHIEWFYRFMQEPKRMFTRYFIGIPHFFLALARQKWFGV